MEEVASTTSGTEEGATRLERTPEAEGHQVMPEEPTCLTSAGSDESLGVLRDGAVIMRALIEASPLGVVAVDPQWRVTIWSPAAERMTGLRAEDVLGSPVTLVSEERRSGFLETMERLREGEDQVRREIKIARCDGKEIDARLWVAPLRGPNGEDWGLMALLQDLAEELGVGKKLRRAERLGTVGRVAAQVAHDLNNRLQALVAYPMLIAEALPPGHAASALCERMAEAVEQVAEVNADMMALGRRGLLERRPTDVNQLIRQAVGEPGTGSDALKIELELEDTMPPVAGSQVQLMRMLANLVSNAREAMKDVGTLRLRTERVQLERPGVATEYVKLEVCDTGCGIPAEIQSRIFDPFFTTKVTDSGRGSGLGLSVVQGVVEDHGGYLEVESEVGKGTTFRVYLPAG